MNGSGGKSSKNYTESFFEVDIKSNNSLLKVSWHKWGSPAGLIFWDSWWMPNYSLVTVKPRHCSLICSREASTSGQLKSTALFLKWMKCWHGPSEYWAPSSALTLTAGILMILLCTFILTHPLCWHVVMLKDHNYSTVCQEQSISVRYRCTWWLAFFLNPDVSIWPQARGWL